MTTSRSRSAALKGGASGTGAFHFFCDDRSGTLWRQPFGSVHGFRLSARTRDEMLVIIAARPISIEALMTIIGHLRGA